MAAPKGSAFWKLRSKHGRDKLFETPELLMEAAEEYFQWCIDNPVYEYEDGPQKWRVFTMHGLCTYLDCTLSYFRSFKAQPRDEKDNFITVINKIEQIVYNQKFTGATAGFLNANIISRDLGLADKVDQRFVDKDDNDVAPIQIIQLPNNGRNDFIDPRIEHK